MPQAIHISPIDNVVVALHPIAKGTLVEVDETAKIFSAPRDKRTEDYISGRFG